MNALIAQAVELHQKHRYMPFWQCVELARHLQEQSARYRRPCESRQQGGSSSRAGNRTSVRFPESAPRRGICAARRDSS
jgi:hypothetical protein